LICYILVLIYDSPNERLFKDFLHLTGNILDDIDLIFDYVFTHIDDPLLVIGRTDRNKFTDEKLINPDKMDPEDVLRNLTNQLYNETTYITRQTISSFEYIMDEK